MGTERIHKDQIFKDKIARLLEPPQTFEVEKQKRRRKMHFKCFCWVRNICKLLTFRIKNANTSTNFFSTTNTPLSFSLRSFPFAFFTAAIFLYWKRVFLLINCFLLNFTQQLKFFRLRFEIVVLVRATCKFGFFYWNSGTQTKKTFRL